MAVAQSGSLRKAADILHISASALHRQITLAEQDLGIELFERLPAGLRLTTAGELLYHDVREWQKQFRQTRMRFDEIKGLKRGEVLMGVIDALCEGFLVELMVAQQASHPWLHLDVRVASSEDITAQIRNADIDFGLILNPQHQPQLTVQSSVAFPMGIALPVHHPLAQTQGVLSLADTQPFVHIIPAAPLVIQPQVSALYGHHQLVPVGKIRCNNIHVMRSLVTQGAGVAVMSLMDALPAVQQGLLVFRPLREKNLNPLTLALCTAPKRQLSRAAQTYMHAISDAMKILQQHISS